MSVTYVLIQSVTYVLILYTPLALPPPPDPLPRPVLSKKAESDSDILGEIWRLLPSPGSRADIL